MTPYLQEDAFSKPSFWVQQLKSRWLTVPNILVPFRTLYDPFWYRQAIYFDLKVEEEELPVPASGPRRGVAVVFFLIWMILSHRIHETGIFTSMKTINKSTTTVNAGKYTMHGWFGYDIWFMLFNV